MKLRNLKHVLTANTPVTVKNEKMLDVTRTAIYNMGRTAPYSLDFHKIDRQHYLQKYQHYQKPAAVTVKAATVLSSNSITGPVDVGLLSQRTAPQKLNVEIAEHNGKLYCLDSSISPSSWFKAIPIATDCQSCNVILMDTDHGVVLKTLRTILPGEPLMMWFSENILALLDMPFLTPANIQAGLNQYRCHLCDSRFDYPNPLKLHIALKCSRLDSNYLWAKLADGFKTSRTPLMPINYFPNFAPFTFELSKSPSATSCYYSKSSTGYLNDSLDSSAKSPSDSSFNTSSDSSFNSSILSSSPPTSTLLIPHSITPPCTTSTPIPERDSVSAFKPFINAISPNSFSCHKQPAIPTPYKVQSPGIPLQSEEHDANIESFVSTLGKSKSGHVCLYCGKVYSRKYGLKIHIRTHTGYKPLKCKYCSRAFGDPSNLNKHVRLHAESETPYKCDLCGKVLVRRRDLERHMRSRHQSSEDNASDLSSDAMDV